MYLQFHTSLQYPNSSEIYRKVACKLQNDFWYKNRPCGKNGTTDFSMLPLFPQAVNTEVSCDSSAKMCPIYFCKSTVILSPTGTARSSGACFRHIRFRFLLYMHLPIPSVRRKRFLLQFLKNDKAAKLIVLHDLEFQDFLIQRSNSVFHRK